MRRGDRTGERIDWTRRCLRRSLLIGQLHPYNRGGHEESHLCLPENLVRGLYIEDLASAW